MTRLDLGNGKWIDVKERLKVRDGRDVHTYSDPGVASDGMTYRYNLAKNQIATAAVRIINWNLEDERGRPITWPAAMNFKDRVQAIESLDIDVFEALMAKLNDFINSLAAESEKEKNGAGDGETNSEVTSPSAAS